jgi:nicotinamide-nucleotide amidase
MLEEQVLPRLLAAEGAPATIHLKRYHCYGLGESHVDALLAGIEDLAPGGGVKMGFRAHYPQIEAKITVRGADMEEVRRKLAPVDAELRRRLGNFIIAEDNETLEGVVLAELAARRARISVVETFTGGQIAARLAHLPGAEEHFCRGIVVRDRAQLHQALGVPLQAGASEYDEETAVALARAARRQSGATHALAVLIDLDAGTDRLDFGGTVHVALSAEGNDAYRRSRILGGREWVRLGSVELGLDSLRRSLQGLPVNERIDFEKV